MDGRFLGILILVLFLVIFLRQKRRTKKPSPEAYFKSLGPDDFLEDFDYIYKIILDYYPYLTLNRHENQLDFRERGQVYRESFKDLKSHRAFESQLRNVLSDLDNDHLDIIDQDLADFLRQIYGDLDKNDWRRKNLREFEKFAPGLRYGKKPAFKPSFMTIGPREDLDSNLEMGYLIKDQIYYINIREMLNYSKGMERHRQFYLEKIDGIKNYSALVLDIRNNTGGNAGYFQEILLPALIDRDLEMESYVFMKSGDLFRDIESQYEYREVGQNFRGIFPEESLKYIEEFPKYRTLKWKVKKDENINFKGRIYLLVSEKVFSSSETMALIFKEEKLGSLVGRNTSGDGLITDPIIIGLERTGYLIRMPKEMGVGPGGEINEARPTRVDIEVLDAEKRAEVLDGRVLLNGDRVLEKIIELET